MEYLLTEHVVWLVLRVILKPLWNIVTLIRHFQDKVGQVVELLLMPLACMLLVGVLLAPNIVELVGCRNNRVGNVKLNFCVIIFGQ
jgi:hypothetical protein